MDNAEKKMRLAREILALSRNTLLVELRFLDLAMGQFEWVSIEQSTLLTNGKHIFYNPKHVLDSFRTQKSIPVRDYLHIVMHCIFRHMYMDPSLNRAYWDLACDISVEHLITELGLKSTAAPREEQQQKYISAIQRELKIFTAEKIYIYLQATVPTEQEIAAMHSVFCGDNHEIWYMTSKEAAKHLGSPQSSGNDNKSSSEPHANSGDDFGNSRAATAKVWQDIAQRMQVELESFGKQRGLNSGALVQNLAAVNREKYDYTAFLKKFSVMGEAMRINDDEFDYIFYTYGMQLYKKMPLIEPLEYKDVKAIKEFVIAIDTSGSTSGELVQKFIQKTYNILKSTESFFTKINLHIIQCDAAIQEDAKITCQEDFDEYLKTMQIRGLGGTDFRPVFEYVDELKCKKEFYNLKGLIYFTDGFGTFPIQKPDYNVAFVFIDDEYSNPQVPPWAIKLILQPDEI